LSSPKKIKLNFDKVKRIIGTNIAETESEAKDNIINFLTKLEFKINNQEQYFLEVTPPSFRGDIQREVDVIEEIARLFGYENIPATLFKSTVVQKGRSERQIIVDKIRNVLVSCGMHQMIGYSMIAPSCFDWLKLPVSHYLRQAIKLTNPLIQDQTIMRTTLIPGLLKAIQWNVNHSMEKIKLFEIGRVYFPQENKPDLPLPVEKLMVGGVITKIGRGDIWEKSEKWDIFYLKGILETLFEELHLSDLDYLSGELPIFEPKQNGIIKAGNKKIAVWGKVEQDITNFLDIPANVYLFELDFTELYPLIKKDITFNPLPRYPFIKRDISIIIPEEVAFAQIQKETLKVNPVLIKQVELFDVFRGDQIKKGYKSIAFSMVFQAEERTLTDMEVDKIMESVKMRLYQLFQAELRE
jgi:phenylalanyl-tRNA synthetase beta chain